MAMEDVAGAAGDALAEVAVEKAEDGLVTELAAELHYHHLLTPSYPHYQQKDLQRKLLAPPC